MNQTAKSAAVAGKEHWTRKGDVKLFMWEKAATDGKGANGTVLFVHGSSMASQPTFDLHVPGRADSSVMDWFAQRGFNTWCVDMEGYGRSDKSRDIYFDIANGADDAADCDAAGDDRSGLKGSSVIPRTRTSNRPVDRPRRHIRGAVAWGSGDRPSN